eukprot:g23759.t1
MTHDVKRKVMIMNVLAEPREEHVQEDMWRYRTEHVESMEENRELCALRAKAFQVFGKDFLTSHDSCSEAGSKLNPDEPNP